MDTMDAIGKRLGELVAERGVTRRELEEKGWLTPVEAIGISRGDRYGKGMETLRALCGALGVTMSEFFDSPLFEIEETLPEYRPVLGERKHIKYSESI